MSRPWDLLDRNWEARLRDVPRERRVFLGLQLFPEASMDYWLKSPDMLAHDDVVVRYCEVLGEAGYRIFVKDHPLQFGFRQRELFERLSKLPFVTLVPYDVPANLLIGQCGISVTFTGTIGFQAALAGLCSVVTDPYYATERHFLHIRSFGEIGGLVGRLERWRPPDDLAATRREIVRHLAAISVEGDYFGWHKFDPENQAAREAVEPLSALAECVFAEVPEASQSPDGALTAPEGCFGLGTVKLSGNGAMRARLYSFVKRPAVVAAVSVLILRGLTLSSRFLLSLLLARMLSPDEMGQYGLVTAVACLRAAGSGS